MNWQVNRPPACTETAAPKACPTCRSGDLVTTSKVISDSTYWRCKACGEVWNASRQQPPRPVWRR